MSHPYRSQPDGAFWSRFGSAGFPAGDVAAAGAPLLRTGDRVVTAGSCFAGEMIPWIEAAGLTYVRAEPPHPAFEILGENLGYRTFSAAYGNIYTARHLRQLLERAYGLFSPAEDRWHADGRVIDPFRPGLKFPARSDREFDLLSAQHLEAVRTAFGSATVFAFTLGLTEAWESSLDGAVYPACPGTIAGTFDADKHRFHNFDVAEVSADIKASIALLREHNSAVRVILTVSPVPLVATATDQHVLVATTYSKAVLRMAAADVVSSGTAVAYFPSYEIVTGPQAPYDFYESDRHDVTAVGVSTVMRALLANSHVPAFTGDAPQRSPAGTLDQPPSASSVAADLSRRVAEAECEEMLADG